MVLEARTITPVEGEENELKVLEIEKVGDGWRVFSNASRVTEGMGDDMGNDLAEIMRRLKEEPKREAIFLDLPSASHLAAGPAKHIGDFFKEAGETLGTINLLLFNSDRVAEMLQLTGMCYEFSPHHAKAFLFMVGSSVEYAANGYKLPPHD